VLAAGDEFKILSQFKMEGEGEDFEAAKNDSGGAATTRNHAPVLSSIAIAHGHIYARTPANLYCIGAKP